MGNILQFRKSQQVSWRSALEQFLTWKRAEGRSKRTIRDYDKNVTQFFRRYPQAFTPGSLTRSVLEYLSDDIKPATYNLRLIYLRTFFNWCMEEQYIHDNPLLRLKKRKDEGRVVHLNQEDLRMLLNCPDRNTFSGLRDYALILLILDNGIRPKEALSLLLEDFNDRSLEIYIRASNAKTRISRTLPVSRTTARAMKKLIQSRHSDWEEDAPIFCSCDGRMLSTETWGQRMIAYSGQIGVKIRPYDLRHVFAMEFLRNGGHALALKKIMGHSSMQMTERYVHLVEGDVKEQHAHNSPIGKLFPDSPKKRKIGKA